MNPFHSHPINEEVKPRLRLLEKWRVLRKWSEKPPEKKKKIVWKICGGLFVLGLGCIIWILSDIPSIEEIQNISFSESSVIYDATGDVPLYSIHGDENRIYVPLTEISPHMATAIIAAEDADFYNHEGVDFRGMLRSVYLLFTTGEIRGSGSTLTQQFARNALLTLDQTLVRKLREIYLSFRIESNFSKEKILEMYLNKISFGNNAFGVEQAARLYFGKPAKDLSLAESVILAAIPQAQTRWSPYGQNKEVRLNVDPEVLVEQNIHTVADLEKLRTDTFSPYGAGLLGKSFDLPDGTKLYIGGRTDYVLNQMKEKGFVSELEYERTKENLQNITFLPYRERILAPHFVFYVRELLEEQLGKDVLEQSGLKIVTTLDADLQKKAEELATKYAERNDDFGVSNIALVSADPQTGQIKAMVGSRDYFSADIDGQVNIITTPRQPGSSFKPLTYAAAFLKGLAPATVLFDVDTEFGNFRPSNFDGKFRGPVPIRTALGNSLNIPAVKAGILAGIPALYDMAQRMGIHFERDADFYGSSMAIGSAEVRPLEMLQAYSVFAAGGKKVPLNPILWVEDKNGDVLLDYRNPTTEPEQAIDPETAYLVTNVLSDPEARGPGWNANLQLSGRPNAAKTGTSNAVDPETQKLYPNDLWTIGFTPQLATAVWAGNNRGYVKNLRADGWSNAAPYWKEFMQYAHEKLPVKNFDRPEGIKTIAVDRFSGKLPVENEPDDLIVQEVFSSAFAPTETGSALTFLEVDRVSGKLPNEFTPPDALEKRAIMNFHSEFPDNPAWENPVQQWVQEHGAEFIAEFGGSNFLTTAPTETESIHDAQNAEKKPTVSIVTPADFGLVTPPYIDVFPNISAPNGLKTVEISWDGEVKTTLRNAPWYGKIQVGPAPSGSTHTIGVKVLDQFYYADESEINVKVGTDEVAPNISFLFPQPNQEITGGGSYTLQVNAVDAHSSVKAVTFLLDGQELGTVTAAPFAVIWNAPNENKHYELTVKALDTSGNTAEQRLNFQTKSTNQAASSFGILEPKNNVSVGNPVVITAGILPEHAANLEKLEIWYRNKGGVPLLLKTFSAAQAGASHLFSTVWQAPAGEFEIWVKLQLASGGSQISQKTSITVQ